MKQMIGYCGLDCEKCDAKLATVNNDQALREKTAKLWSELNGVEITPEMICCDGCRTDGRKTPFCETFCQVRQCALGKYRRSERVPECGDLRGLRGNGQLRKGGHDPPEQPGGAGQPEGMNPDRSQCGCEPFRRRFLMGIEKYSHYLKISV